MNISLIFYPIKSFMKYFDQTYEIQSAEAVGPGHPDKICDQISDAILDACLKIDSDAKVACEVFSSYKLIVIGGEITISGYVDIIKTTWEVLLSLGYSKNDFIIVTNINQQSSNINAAVMKDKNKIGSGDQGIVYGYACDQTDSYLPLAFCLAKELVQKATELIRQKKLSWAKYDMKSLVSIKFNYLQQPQLESVIFSIQHDQDVTNQQIQTDIKELVFKPVLNVKYGLNNNYKKLINTSKKFVVGGVAADTGLTNRKLMVDSYGGIASHGGGGYSGKDPSKVDRTGAYLARWIAKNLVAAKICHWVEVKIVYALGWSKPVNFDLKYQLNKQFSHLTKKQIIEAITNVFPLDLEAVITTLGLRKTKFFPLSTNGHYGRNELDLGWEKTNQKKKLLKLLK